jgi:hypothetical protein
MIPKPKKATRISFGSSKRNSPELSIRYDQQSDGQGKQAGPDWKNHALKNRRLEEIPARPRVAPAFQSIYRVNILLETGENKADNVTIAGVPAEVKS